MRSTVDFGLLPVRNDKKGLSKKDCQKTDVSTNAGFSLLNVHNLLAFAAVLLLGGDCPWLW